MKFAHMSDCHIGSWQRTPRLAEASITAFSRAMDIAVEQGVDFILISGDLFDTSIPAIEKIRDAAIKFRQIKEKGIPVYLIAGSHDYSASGKTMLDVLESAGLFTNVSKIVQDGPRLKVDFTVDQKTGAKIVGLLGKKGGLEKNYYYDLFKDQLESEPGFKVFMLHSGIEELKPAHLEQMEAVPLAFFPKGFDYYAAGHIHTVYSKHMEGYGLFAFPGPLFPNNFDELEKLGCGGFYIVEFDGSVKHTYVPVPVHKFESLSLDCTGLTPREVEKKIFEFASKDFSNTIVGLRLHGTIISGKTTDINFRYLLEIFYSKNAICVLKNTYSLVSEFYEDVKIEVGSVDDVEDAMIRQGIGTVTFTSKDAEFEFSKLLIEVLSIEKDEGERDAIFQSRVLAAFRQALAVLKP